MNVIELASAEYGSLVKVPFSVFDSVPFNQLNAHKVEAVKYLIFNDGKNRFGIIAGIRDGTLRAPFSAPYACFSEIGKNNKVATYGSTVTSLLEYAKSLGLQRVSITLPPTVYDESHISKIWNGFYNAGFQVSSCDLNFQYDLCNFGQDYEMTIDPKARQKLRASFRSNLIFEKTDDIKSAYEVIKKNRTAKNYPLWMTYENVLETIKIIKSDFFIVYTADRTAIASAMVYEVAVDKVQIIYWGNLPGSDELRPMNFMAFHVFQFYKNRGIKLVDIGPSTESSVPNLGLCDFKQAIGCTTSSKFAFEVDV